jgi:hypothetical protein
MAFLFRCCRGQAKGLFTSFLSRLTLSEVTYCHIKQPYDKGSLTQNEIQMQAQRHFVVYKVLTLLVFSKLELQQIALKTENRELQMEVVMMRLEESIEYKFP